MGSFCGRLVAIDPINGPEADEEFLNFEFTKPLI
jgi:hypothetical protein